MARFLYALIVCFVGAPPAYADGDDSTSARVALVQLDSADVGNFQKMEELAKQAKQLGAALVVFPEASSFGWLNPKAFSEAEPIPGAQASKFGAIAKSANIWLATGLEERGPKASEQAFRAYDPAF